MPSKLYIVVRRDLAPGLRAAQAVHAARLFVSEHPEVDRHWYETSNTLVLLEVPTKVDLMFLSTLLGVKGVRHSMFHEPDLGGEPTALAVAPEGKRLLRKLPLAFERAA